MKKAMRLPPEFLNVGPEVGDEREAAVDQRPLGTRHERCMHMGGAQQPPGSCSELARIQAAPDDLRRVH